MTRETKRKSLEMAYTFTTDVVRRAIKSCMNSKTPVRACGSKNSAPIFSFNTHGEEFYEEEVQPYRKTDYKPMIYINSYKEQTHFS